MHLPAFRQRLLLASSHASDLGIHGLGVETLDEVHGRPRLFRVDGDRLAVLADVGAAVRPEDREQRDVGVAAVAHGGAERMPDGLALLADAQPVLPGIRVLLADLLQQVGAHRHRKRRLPPRQQLPLAADEVVVGIQPPAVLRRDVGGEVVQVGQVVEVEVGVAETGAERGEIVTGARLHLGGLLGLQLEVGDDVEPHLDLVLGAPLVELPLQLLVGVGHEAGDRQERELAASGRRPALGRRPGCRRRRPRCRGTAAGSRHATIAGDRSGRLSP